MTRARAALAAVTASVLAACGGAGDGTPAGPGDGPVPVDPAACGLAQFEDAAADGPVEITFWHTMNRTNAEWLRATIDAFHEAQPDVRVELVQFPGYEDVFTRYTAGLSTGDLPDLVQLEETTVQKVIDSRSTVPVQACVDADRYDTGPFLPRALAYYSYQGVLHAMPWTVSNPILVYDASRFVAAGLDPADPPETLDEVREYSQRIVERGAARHGIALRIEPYVFEFLNAKSGGTYVDNGNGREARATAATIDTDVGRAIFRWWYDMVESGLALDTGGAPGNFDHMLAVGTGEAAMAIEASGVLGIVRDVLESGQYPGVRIAAAPLPALRPGGGVPVGDGALWIPQDAAAPRRGAAWQLVKFLASAEQQAALAVAGGYAPVREDATEVPALVEKWRTDPIFRVAYDQLVSGPADEASVGSLIGDYQGVRDAVRNAMTAMLDGRATPEEAAARAQEDATAAIEAYNARI
ncbi:MAG: ABC transporter substrate-binding protein [Acidimicrobiia bacterium]|nr:MAG: ABC transporter substrate-binding protein [Acidimicrobiia bacterium]